MRIEIAPEPGDQADVPDLPYNFDLANKYFKLIDEIARRNYSLEMLRTLSLALATPRMTKAAYELLTSPVAIRRPDAVLEVILRVLEQSQVPQIRDLADEFPSALAV